MAMVIKALTSEQLQVLVDHLRGADAEPHEVMFELILLAGLRSDEAVAVKHKCFELDRGLFHLKQAAKGSDTLTWDLNVGGMADRLRAAYMARDMLVYDDDPIIWLFTDQRQTPETAKRWLRRKWKKLTTKLYGPNFNLGIHCLRHTYAIEARKYCSVEQLMQLMRHKSLQSTWHYMARPTMEEILTIQRELAARLYDKTYNED